MATGSTCNTDKSDHAGTHKIVDTPDEPGRRVEISAKITRISSTRAHWQLPLFSTTGAWCDVFARLRGDVGVEERTAVGAANVHLVLADGILVAA